jgi:hypothetical protein
VAVRYILPDPKLQQVVIFRAADPKSLKAVRNTEEDKPIKPTKPKVVKNVVG